MDKSVGRVLTNCAVSGTDGGEGWKLEERTHALRWSEHAEDIKLYMYIYFKDMRRPDRRRDHGSATIMVGPAIQRSTSSEKSRSLAGQPSREESPCAGAAPAYMYRAHICADMFVHSPDDASQSYMC